MWGRTLFGNTTIIIESRPRESKKHSFLKSTKAPHSYPTIAATTKRMTDLQLMLRIGENFTYHDLSYGRKSGGHS